MTVEGIDHVHIEVADRETAAEWYRTVLGLVPHAPLLSWAQDPMGPLILATCAGQPVLSLFARDCAPPSRDSTIAFRVSGAAFLQVLQDLPSFGLSAQPVDHDLSWSVYFSDPDGNRLEVTTYDVAVVTSAMR